MASDSSANATIPGDAPAKKTKPGFTGVTETMLVTLAIRADDAASSDPFLRDTWARTTLEKLEYALPTIERRSAVYYAVLLRCRLFDAWAAEFIDAHPDGVNVLNLACGLDSRALRLGRAGPRVRWFDVDLPEVADLRRRLLPAPEGSAGYYSVVGASVTDEAAAWLDDVPADRPTFVIMEGLVMYLERADIEKLFGRICGRFGSGGQIVLDTVGSLYLSRHVASRMISDTGANIVFGMDNARELLPASPRLKVRDGMPLRQLPGFERVPLGSRILFWICSWIPWLNTINSYARYEF